MAKTISLSFEEADAIVRYTIALQNDLPEFPLPTFEEASAFARVLIWLADNRT